MEEALCVVEVNQEAWRMVVVVIRGCQWSVGTWSWGVPSLVKPVCTGTDINKVAERWIRKVGLSI